MYNVVKSKIKFNNEISNDSFTCYLGVRQGESLSPFLFSMYLNDIEEHFMLNTFEGVNLGILKVFLLLYADDIVLFAESETGLQKGLDLLEQYCTKWKLCVNVNKTKILIFKKGGQNRRNLKFYYKGNTVEIVNSLTYLGIVFTTGGSFSLTYDALSGQALKAIYKLKSNLVKYPDISVNHRLDLFNKLIEPILSYGCEVWGLNNSVQIERIHIRYCKQVLGVRLQTQNNFVYGELGRVPLINKRIICVLKYWFKILQSDDVKYIKIVYDMLLHDHDIYPEKKYWVKSLKDVLDSLGFSDVWFFQGVGDI